MRQANPQVRFDHIRAGELRPASQHGQHRDEVLSELQVDSDEIERLANLGVFG